MGKLSSGSKPAEMSYLGVAEEIPLFLRTECVQAH